MARLNSFFASCDHNPDMAMERPVLNMRNRVGSVTAATEGDDGGEGEPARAGCFLIKYDPGAKAYGARLAFLKKKDVDYTSQAGDNGKGMGTSPSANVDNQFVTSDGSTNTNNVPAIAPTVSQVPGG
jgi:hypothetical protein